MKLSKMVSLAAVLLAAAAAVLCYHLLVKHVTGSSGAAWFDAGCRDAGEKGGGADCAAVLASPYSYWPPKRVDEAPNTPHIPVAFLGLVYYSVLGVWLIGVGRPSRARRWLHLVPMVTIGLGLAGSVYFTFIMFTMLEEWCPWCLVTHLLNLGLGVCVVAMWPRAAVALPRATGVAEETTPAVLRPDGPVPVSRDEHPSRRLVWTTVLAVVLAVVGADKLHRQLRFGHAIGSYQRGLAQCSAALNRIAKEPEKLVDAWRRAPRRTITIRPDDPVRQLREEGPAPLDLVVFSDFQCPSCRKFAFFLERKVFPLFDGHVRIVFKHYPLHRDCNPATATRMHAHACEAAVMAEAARIVGGDGAFWKAHDYFFRHQRRLAAGELTPEVLAEAVGVDPERLRDAMSSPSIRERIAEDARVGHGIGVTGTPSLFMESKLVDTLARGQIGFWDRIADAFWTSRKLSRPESTKIVTKAAVHEHRDAKGE